MTSNKPSAPETLEELRAALGELADEYEAWAGDIVTSHAARSCHRKSADHLRALLPPAPEPIKVGDRVQFVDNPRTGTLVAVDEWEAWVRWDVGARTQVAFERLRRVDSSPSPEPETGHEFRGVNGHPDDDECTYRVDGTDDTYCGRTAAEHQDPHCTICGVGTDPDGDHIGCRYPDPAPSPSPEVGEGWRHPVDMAEADAAWRAGVLEFWTGSQWFAQDLDQPSHHPFGPDQYRVPSGWAEGRELVAFTQAAADERTIGGEEITDYTLEGVGLGDGVLIGDLFVPADPDGKVWVDPLPKQETETVEPHESEDAAELAAAVAAGLVVDSIDDFGAWHRSLTRSFEQFDAFIEAGQLYRIHGTVPGYGETGGAS